MAEPSEAGTVATQGAETLGANNIVVQIAGDRNTVNLKGLAHLTLTRYLTRRRIDSDADLLSPYTRSIPLIGREREMAELRAWLASDRPISVRVLTGPGGSGKTRLALELCEAMLEDGWDAGFVESSELVRFRTQQDLSTWGWQRPTLIVIDYAAVHAERLSGWLKELSDNAGRPDRPLRLLLLERHAETGSGWWQTAFGRGGWGAQAMQKLLDPAEPVELAPIMASAERRAIIEEMIKMLGPATRPPAAGVDRIFDKRLAELTWGGEPLFLMIAGLVAQQAGASSALALGRVELAFLLAERELARIELMAGEDRSIRAFLVHLAAYATLCGGLDRSGAWQAVTRERELFGRAVSGGDAELADLLHQALPSPDGGIRPILPEVIGEAAILRVLGTSDADAEAAVLRAFEFAGPKVTATVIRTAQDFMDAGHRAPLDWMDALIERASIDLEQLMAVADQLPQSSLALRDHAVRVTGIAVDQLRQRILIRDEAALLSRFASMLKNLSSRLSQAGRRREALAPAQEAVEIYRELVAKSPDSYRPDLAGSLTNFAVRLSELGRLQDALEPAQEASSIYRNLADQAPDTYQYYLAASLNNLANVLSGMGQRQEGLARADEAVAIYRELAAKAPEAYRPDFAASLNNLAVRLSEVGRLQDALNLAHESVSAYRELAAEAPDAYRPDLAMSLNNLAIRLTELGFWQDALPLAEEAVAVYRDLAAKAPDAYRPDLATSLNSLAASLSTMGRLQEALALAEESVAIRLELAARNPDAYRRDLASSLSNLAGYLSHVGRSQEALGPAQKGVALYRELAANAPDAYRSDLAGSLSNLAVRLSELGRQQEALPAAEEAVALYRELAERDPNRSAMDLALSLSIVADLLEKLRRPEEAVAADEHAIQIIIPRLSRFPQLAYQAIPVLEDYVRRCETIGQDPDVRLLAPVLDALKQLPQPSVAKARVNTQ